MNLVDATSSHGKPSKEATNGKAASHHHRQRHHHKSSENSSPAHDRHAKKTKLRMQLQPEHIKAGVTPGVYQEAKADLLVLTPEQLGEAAPTDKPHRARHSDRTPVNQNKALRASSFHESRVLTPALREAEFVADQTYKRAYQTSNQDDGTDDGFGSNQKIPNQQQPKKPQRIFVRSGSMPSLGDTSIEYTQDDDDLLFIAPDNDIPETIAEGVDPKFLFDSPPRRIRRRRSGSVIETAWRSMAREPRQRGVRAHFSGSSADSSVIGELLRYGESDGLPSLDSPPRQPRRRRRHRVDLVQSHFFLDDDSSVSSFVMNKDGGEGAVKTEEIELKLPSILEAHYSTSSKPETAAVTSVQSSSDGKKAKRKDGKGQGDDTLKDKKLPQPDGAKKKADGKNETSLEKKSSAHESNKSKQIKKEGSLGKIKAEDDKRKQTKKEGSDSRIRANSLENGKKKPMKKEGSLGRLKADSSAEEKPKQSPKRPKERMESDIARENAKHAVIEEMERSWHQSDQERARGEKKKKTKGTEKHAVKGKEGKKQKKKRETDTVDSAPSTPKPDESGKYDDHTGSAHQKKNKKGEQGSKTSLPLAEKRKSPKNSEHTRQDKLAQNPSYNELRGLLDDLRVSSSLHEPATYKITGNRKKRSSSMGNGLSETTSSEKENTIPGNGKVKKHTKQRPTSVPRWVKDSGEGEKKKVPSRRNSATSSSGPHSEKGKGKLDKGETSESSSENKSKRGKRSTTVPRWISDSGGDRVVEQRRRRSMGQEDGNRIRIPVRRLSSEGKRFKSPQVSRSAEVSSKTSRGVSPAKPKPNSSSTAVSGLSPHAKPSSPQKASGMAAMSMQLAYNSDPGAKIKPKTKKNDQMQRVVAPPAVYNKAALS